MELGAVTALTDEPARIPESELKALAALKLRDEDGVPLETPWHRYQINLLDECIKTLWAGRDDFFVGGNMFLYFSPQQEKTADYKGPDLFVVREVEDQRPRTYWAIWEEGNKTPDLVVELLSESTRAEDLGRKKRLYERRLHVPEYVCCGPAPLEGAAVELYAWRLSGPSYQPIAPDERGWVWSEVLEAWLGIWEGEYARLHTRWLRLFDREGALIPTRAEAAEQRAKAAEQRAEAERRRAEAAEQRAAAERQRAEQAERERDTERQRLDQIKARLREMGIALDL